jgi:hypothetical protein
MTAPELRITSPVYWRALQTVARWSRRAGFLAAVSFVTVLFAAVVLVVAGERGAGPYLARTASQTAWVAAFGVPAWIILGRLERTAARYAQAGQ